MSGLAGGWELVGGTQGQAGGLQLLLALAWRAVNDGSRKVTHQDTTAPVTATRAEPAPKTAPTSGNGPLVGGAIIGALLAGGLVAFLVTRRRSAEDPYR